MTGSVELRVERTSDVIRSPRVMQMSSLFDVELTEKAHQVWDVRMPLGERPWNVGLIVGPSGAGKSSVARDVFGDALLEAQEWSHDRALLDDFPKDMGIKEIITLLSAVGFNSPPAWMRPFATLSNGEQFRVSCARALADTQGLVAIDEFTSVVDRQVAQVASHTVQKTVRRADRQLVAISCHYDILDWLQPDWIYQPHGGEFSWRSVQPRPRVELAFHRVDRAAWRLFSPHHYLSGDLMSSAKCFGAFLPDGRCVAFSAIRVFPHPNTRNIYMGHRLVVLPDWQGLGIGLAFDDWLGWHLYRRGYRYRNTVAHPTMIAGYARSPRWEDVTAGGTGGQSVIANIKARNQSRNPSVKAQKSLARNQVDPRRLSTRCFQYRPPREDPYP